MLILSRTKLSILPINPLKTTQTKIDHLRHMKNPGCSLAQKNLHMKSSNCLYHPPFFLPSFLHLTTTQPQDTYTQTLEATSQNHQRTHLPTNRPTSIMQFPSSLLALLATSPLLLTIHANPIPQTTTIPAPMPTGFCDNPLRCPPQHRNLSGLADPFCDQAGGCILPPLPTLTGTSTATTTALATPTAPLVLTHGVDEKCNKHSSVCEIHWGPKTMERRASPTKTEVMARDKMAKTWCPKPTSSDMVVCLEGHLWGSE